MKKDKKYSGKLAVGIFAEGDYLHMVCLAKREKKIELVDVQRVKLATRLENVVVEEEILTEALANISDEPIPIDLTAETPSQEIDMTAPKEESEDNVALLESALYKYPSRKYKVAISVPEPQIYYAYFGRDWGLDGEKLKKKVLEELSKENAEAGLLTPDAVYVHRLADGRLMAIVRDSEISVLNLFTRMSELNQTRPPRIAFVESAEISLVNLIRANYRFAEEEISVVVYVGNEFSRLIFFQGNNIYNVSYIIGAGLDSENIAHTIYSRILLEQDNLNLPHINNVILTGEAYEIDLKNFLKRKMSAKIEVDYIRLPALNVVGIDPIFARFAVAIGAAWRVLDHSNSNLLPMNLLPMTIRDGQKRFKLGVSGWILLTILPLITFFSTVKISQEHRFLTQLEVKQQALQSDLDYLKAIEKKVQEEQAKLAYYDKAFGVLDSMLVGSKTWSSFLLNSARLAKTIGGIWITEVKTLNNNQAVITGYSLSRARIPRFANALNRATLNRVEVKSIRDRTVYYFEILANLPKE